ncbi:recombinase family protein [Boseongicola sp. H5]|uniref:recombinase family protein n=1 Tax=Boseongicola sp. H5 TaxID=2763261 RepID=UPI001D0B1561|nr:recombinase family protein [Boseongicola sp. H5]
MNAIPETEPTNGTRAAIYARYSTDLQSERSIEDQIALCQTYAKREGLHVAASYQDAAQSGASVLGRDGLLDLLDAARRGSFDIIIVEALDRLSRDMEDLAGLHKRLSFLGIEIRAVHEGVASTVLVGLRGLVGQLYREDNVLKIRRGMSGRAKEGRSSGGLAYGYEAVPGEVGARRIVEAEADVIRRIFETYLDGKSPRDIAHRLNAEGIAPPRGSRWNASTINGNATRGNGILQNPLYAGRQVWNRVRMVKDPDTGRRVSRPNPPEEWVIAEVPELAILAHGVFEAAGKRKAERSIASPRDRRRPRHLLSGLLRCASCGAGMSTNGKDRSGRIRVRCSAHRESGSCPNPQTFYLDRIEEAVLSGLRAELRHPDVIAEYVRTYHEERKRLAANAVKGRARIEKRLAAIERELARLVNAICDGSAVIQQLEPRMLELQDEQTSLGEELEAAPEPPEVISLHHSTLKRYEEQLADLQTTLATGIRSGDTEAAQAMRDLVDTVTVSRDPSRTGGVEVDIAGRLNHLLGPKAFPQGVKGVWGSVVAEEGLEPPTRGL